MVVGEDDGEDDGELVGYFVGGCVGGVNPKVGYIRLRGRTARKGFGNLILSFVHLIAFEDIVCLCCINLATILKAEPVFERSRLTVRKRFALPAGLM